MNITVYTKPACPQCDMTKRALTAKGVEFDTVDISQEGDGYAVVQSLGYRQVPVVVTGDQHWSGFRPDLIEQVASEAMVAQ